MTLIAANVGLETPSGVRVLHVQTAAELADAYAGTNWARATYC